MARRAATGIPPPAHRHSGYLYLFQKYDIATACCAAMTEGAAILHHPCDRTLQILIWRRCRGRSRIKAPRCWPTTPILPSKLWVRLSPLVPTRAVLSQPRLQQDRSDEIGQDCPESPEVLLLPKERGAPVAPTIGLNETIIAQDGDPGIPMSTARLFAEHCRKIIGFRVVRLVRLGCVASPVPVTATDHTTKPIARLASTASAAPRRRLSIRRPLPSPDH